MADNGPNVSEGAASVADGVAAMELGLEDALQGVYTNQQHKYSQRTLIKTILSTGTMLADKKLVVGGWVKTGRVAGGGAFGFLELNDGSCASSLQVSRFALHMMLYEGFYTALSGAQSDSQRLMIAGS